MVMFQDEAAAKKMLKERVQSHQWWIFFWTDETSHIITEIEQTHYSGDDNGAFEIVAGSYGFPFIAVVLAKKDRMSPGQLSNLLNKHSTREMDRTVFESHDIIHFDHATLMQFIKWIGEPPSETNGRASY